MRILLIVAAGKSSRFGGFPKAFCQVGNNTVIENTISRATPYFDRIYVGVNRTIFDEYKGKVKGCTLFSIITGQGDAHSLLKCMKYIKESEDQVNEDVDLFFCWGDAFFANSKPFEQFCGNKRLSKVEVACSLDTNPYAWFDIEDDEIVKSHFAKDEGGISSGLHDQSLFRMDLNYGLEYLNQYRESLGIPMDNDEREADKNEMKLLKSFEFLADKYNTKAKAVIVDAGNIVSFNTKEELDVVVRRYAHNMEMA